LREVHCSLERNVGAACRARDRRRHHRSGAGELYNDPSIELVGIDVYASPHTHLLADAHRLPFVDRVFDGVWIQAVLEHVLEP